jgi:hypothetical protein
MALHTVVHQWDTCYYWKHSMRQDNLALRLTHRHWGTCRRLFWYTFVQDVSLLGGTSLDLCLSWQCDVRLAKIYHFKDGKLVWRVR